MAKFEVVFEINPKKWGQLEIDADYYREIKPSERYEFIKGDFSKSSTNIVLTIDSNAVLYIKKLVEPENVVPENPMIEKFYQRYPQLQSA